MIRFFSLLIVGISFSLAGTISGVLPAQCAGQMNVIAKLPSLSPSGFSLSDYRKLKARDEKTAQLVLLAMREAVFYAQGSAGKPVLCASPAPISGDRLMDMLESEIATPTNPGKNAYNDLDHVAYILMYALRKHGACK